MDFGTFFASIGVSHAGPANFKKIIVFLLENHKFSRLGAPEKGAQTTLKPTWKGILAPRASWTPLGFDFGGFLASKTDCKTYKCGADFGQQF